MTRWSPAPEEELHGKVLSLKHKDFRDLVPPTLEEVVEAYRAHVQESTWTVGLFEMWAPKAKYVKHAVHIPCWGSFRVLPWKWRGVWLGKTWNECLWTGWRQMRWSRAAYGGSLGREYVMPVHNVGHHGYLSDIRALFGLSCAMACVFSCGIGQILSLCGNICSNFGAIYTCNARRKVRQKYGLPPAIPGCVPGLDDCLVDFFCFYCASHQLLRELAIRGVDGPGMHVLDVAPEAYAHVEGIEKAVEQRRRICERMAARPPRFLQPSTKSGSKRGAILSKLDEAFLASAVNVTETVKGAVLLQSDTRRDTCDEFGWNCGLVNVAPTQIRMQRTTSDIVSGASALSKQEVGELFGIVDADSDARMARNDETSTPLLERSWSVAY